VAFLGLFALDVFGGGYGVWGTLVALGMHLIPSAIVLLALFIAWRREWLGGILFLAVAVLFNLWFKWLRDPGPVFLIMTVPLMLTGVLFLLNWWYRRQQGHR